MKKKILFISHMYPTNFDKSYGKVIHEQALSLIERGYEVKVICPFPFVPPFLKYFKKRYQKLNLLSKSELHDNIEVYYPQYISLPRALLFNYSGSLMYYGILKQVKEVRKNFKFDIIHAHFTLPDGEAALKISKYFKVPLVTTIQATDLDITIHRNKQSEKKVREVLKNAQAVITPTPRLQLQLERVFDISSSAIGYGVDIESTISNTSSHPLLKNNNEIVIVSVSRLLKTKGIEYNIEAINLLKEKFGNIRYLIVGDGPEKERLEKIVKQKELEDIVIFTGKQSKKRTMEFIATSNIFSLPSWQETFGLVYLEAMINEKPVIGCEGQGFDGIITHNKNGFLAKPKDYKSVHGIMEYIIENPLKIKEISLAAKHTVITNFSFKEIAEKIGCIYEDL